MLLACVVLLPLLGHNRLTDWDEGVYAGISRAMLGGTWLVPHWNGAPWLEKPPLELWLTALSFKLFGVSEFTARLVSACSGVALVGLLHGWLALRCSRLAAWLSSVFLLASFGFLHAARVGEMDVLLALGCMLALIGLAEVPGSDRAWYLFWAGCAIALMTKGAASVTLFLTLAFAAAWHPMLFRRMRWNFCCGCALFLLAVIPWHAYMLHRFGSSFTAEYLGLHVLARATTQLDGHRTHWWFYLRVLLVSAAPFVLVYPVALAGALRKPALRVFAVFSLVMLLLFSLVQTRLPHYIVPFYPVLALLVAIWCDEWLQTARGPLKMLPAAVAVYVAAILLTAAPRKALHSPRLPNGIVVPDNREQVALLKQVFGRPSSALAVIPGPLLSWRSGTSNPIPTTVFYAGRLVIQVGTDAAAQKTLHDKYADDLTPLAAAVRTEPRLMLLDRSLLPLLPANMTFTPAAGSANLLLGTIAEKPSHP